MENDNILRKFNFKITKPRETIYGILMAAEEGLDAERIKTISEEQGSSINLSTVYRTLELFSNLGIAEKFDLGENKYNYRLRKNDHYHSISCEICGEEIKVDCPMTKIEEFIKKETGFTVLEHHLELKGICKKCSTTITTDNDEKT